jgi:hypothetical protein
MIPADALRGAKVMMALWMRQAFKPINWLGSQVPGQAADQMARDRFLTPT